MRWDCEKQGCFNRLRRPKIEVLSDCLPGKFGFSDVDGIIEFEGRGLLLEWKCKSTFIPEGQSIMYHKLTRTGLLSVLVIHGNAETMKVKEYCWFKHGRKSCWVKSDLDGVRGEIGGWMRAQGAGVK